MVSACIHVPGRGGGGDSGVQAIATYTLSGLLTSNEGAHSRPMLSYTGLLNTLTKVIINYMLED